MERANEAIAALDALGPDVAVCCLYRSAVNIAVPDALTVMLSSVQWVDTDQHPLAIIDPRDHHRAHRAWLLACEGRDRVGQCTLRLSQALTDTSGGIVAAPGPYAATVVDLIAVEGLDVVILAFAPRTGEIDDQDRALDVDVDVEDEDAAGTGSAWFGTSTSFRLRIDRTGHIAGGTMNVAEVLGRPLVELLGEHCQSLVHPENHQQARDSWVEVLDAEGPAVHSRTRLLTVGGAWRWFEVTTWNALEVPQFEAIIADFRDIDDLVESERARATTAREHARLLSVFDEVDEMVLVAQLGFGVVYLNQACRAVFTNDPMGHLLIDHVPNEISRYLTEEILPELQQMQRWEGDLELSIAGTPRVLAITATPVGQVASARLDSFGGLDHLDDDGIYVGVIMRDVTRERNHARDLDRQARRDSLTGLPNRLALMEHLEHIVGTGDADDEISICFVDLDNLKVVNDGLGHGSGDRLLQATAEAILATAPPFVARFGGDEFVTVAERSTTADAQAAATRILSSLAGIHIEGVVTQVTASVGVASCRRADLVPERLIGDSDVAMYAAKHQGRARVAVFDNALRATAARRFELGNGLRQALDDGALEIVLQPVFALATGDVACLETLSRWSLAYPEEFIPVAEDVGLIGLLGKWALESGLDALAALDDAGCTSLDVSVSVNVSAGQLLDPGFPAMVLEAVAERGIAPSRLMLELTETALIDPRSDTSRVLESLHTAGVRLALDDFGSGFSSLAYLRRYPIDVLKLDNTYTQALITDDETRVITESVVAMAARLGIAVVAEGIETLEQLEALRSLGVHCGQGFLFGHPVSLASMLSAGSESPAWRTWAAPTVPAPAPTSRATTD